MHKISLVVLKREASPHGPAYKVEQLFFPSSINRFAIYYPAHGKFTAALCLHLALIQSQRLAVAHY